MRDITCPELLKCPACGSRDIYIDRSVLKTPEELAFWCNTCHQEVPEMRDLQTAPESLFWYWIKERHDIFLRRFVDGAPKPWTTDPVLQNYKFTNPFRENDRGTVWLRKKFLEPHRNDDLSLIAFNICWYRMFNWIGTGELLGWQTAWDAPAVQRVLEGALAEKAQVFTGAHIVYSPPGFGKVEAIVEVCRHLYDLRYEVVRMSRHRSLELVFDLLKTVHCVGGFMAYEIVSDMRHTRLLEGATDIMTWANPGPGAVRGLRRLDLPSQPSYDAINSMRALLERSTRGLALTPEEQPRWPLLEMRDIEHSLCEFDKYCRVTFGEGAPRSKFNGA